MKRLPDILGGLLGLAFVAFALMFFLKLPPDQPEPPAGSPAALFMAAFVPTGYLALVKVCEGIGGILVAIVNILAFHILIGGGAGLADPVLIVICLIAAYLLWHGRARFLGLLNHRTNTP